MDISGGYYCVRQRKFLSDWDLSVGFELTWPISIESHLEPSRLAATTTAVRSFVLVVVVVVYQMASCGLLQKRAGGNGESPWVQVQVLGTLFSSMRNFLKVNTRPPLPVCTPVCRIPSDGIHLPLHPRLVHNHARWLLIRSASSSCVGYVIYTRSLHTIVRINEPNGAAAVRWQGFDLWVRATGSVWVGVIGYGDM